MSPQNSANANEPNGASGGIQIKDDHFNLENNSQQRADTSDQSSFSFNSHQQTAYLQDPYQQLQNSPEPVETGSIKRSSSNLTSFAQTANSNQRDSSYKSNNMPIKASTSKTQPIPMKPTSQPMKLNQVPDAQRASTEHNDDGNSTDEYNSSSIASTPDTMYYFKLKSAAFVPSASFNNNYYASGSIGSGVGHEQDNLPFMNLIGNEQGNPSTNKNVSLSAICFHFRVSFDDFYIFFPKRTNITIVPSRTLISSIKWRSRHHLQSFPWSTTFARELGLTFNQTRTRSPHPVRYRTSKCSTIRCNSTSSWTPEKKRGRTWRRTMLPAWWLLNRTTLSSLNRYVFLLIWTFLSLFWMILNNLKIEKNRIWAEQCG